MSRLPLIFLLDSKAHFGQKSLTIMVFLEMASFCSAAAFAERSSDKAVRWEGLQARNELELLVRTLPATTTKFCQASPAIMSATYRAISKSFAASYFEMLALDPAYLLNKRSLLKVWSAFHYAARFETNGR